MMAAFQLKTGRITKIQQRTRRKSSTQNSSTAKKVALERLSWKPVELPDRLEDAEGFYGLEEIDDVEIARDKSGNVEYIVKDSNLPAEQTTSADESEWEGFEDQKQIPAEAAFRNREHGEQPRQETSITELKESALSQSENGARHEGGHFSAWTTLGLHPRTVSAIARLGFRRPTPIQRAAIPEICAGRDIIGKAPTGSGKTLAFGVPILEHILRFREGKRRSKAIFAPIAFIISPTRELALQLEEHLKALCSSVAEDSRIATITGGLAVQKQQRLLTNADIVIGTPGRLWDVFNSSVGLLEGLRKIRFLVIDEADRLLSSGHFREVEDILQSLDRVKDKEPLDAQASGANLRQTLVFSATFHRDLQQKLAGKGRTVARPNSIAYLIDKLAFRDPAGKPKFVDANPVGKSQLAPLLKEAMLECAATEKDLYLYALLLLQPEKTKTLVFANSINTVRHITLFLQALQLPAHALHSQMPQRSRLRALERFAAGKIPTSKFENDAPFDPNQAISISGAILVATDVAARGLDIPAVNLVVHYHTPRSADGYIHRSGRTARGSASGTALLLCSPDEVVPVRRLVAKIHVQQQRNDIDASPLGLRSARLDRSLVSRLRPRMQLAAKIASLETDAARVRSSDNFLREAAEDLGIDLDDHSDGSNDGGRRNGGKDQGKKHTKNANGSAESKRLRADLRTLLRRRVNVGVSERYLTAGGVDVDSLLRGEAGDFIGRAGGLEID